MNYPTMLFPSVNSFGVDFPCDVDHIFIFPLTYPFTVGVAVGSSPTT